MNLVELRSFIYSITKDYFKNAEVRWGEVNSGASSDLPLVKLSLGNVKRVRYPYEEIVDGVVCKKNPSSVLLTVRLFTHGKREHAKFGDYYINTAASDLQEYVSYMMSDYINYKCLANDTSILVEGEAQDMTALKDSDYEYRAMQVFRVYFMQNELGIFGTNGSNSSGGDTAHLGVSQEYFNKININEMRIE